MTLISEVHEGPMVPAPVNLAQLADMRAAFATNAVVGVRAIASIDDIRWAEDHPMIGLPRKEYAELPTESL